jgi:hypothetical protein
MPPSGCAVPVDTALIALTAQPASSAVAMRANVWYILLQGVRHLRSGMLLEFRRNVGARDTNRFRWSVQTFVVEFETIASIHCSSNDSLV